MTTNAMLTRRSNPVIRNPGKISSRAVPQERERRQSVAETQDAADITIGAVLARMERNISVQPVDVAAGKRRENNVHAVILPSARRGGP